MEKQYSFNFKRSSYKDKIRKQRKNECLKNLLLVLTLDLVLIKLMLKHRIRIVLTNTFNIHSCFVYLRSSRLNLIKFTIFQNNSFVYIALSNFRNSCCSNFRYSLHLSKITFSLINIINIMCG